MARLYPLPTWVDAVTSEEANTTANERHVALTLAKYMSAAGDGAYPGNKRLARETERGLSTVREALRGLDDKGWLKRTVNPGRGKANDYEARIPRSYYEALDPKKKRQLLAVFGVERLVDTTSAAEAVTGHESPADEGLNGGATTGEKRQDPAVFEEEKTAEIEHEKRRDQGEKTASPQAPTTPRDHSSTTPSGAGALDLAQELATLRVSTKLRAKALEDPDRARAWAEVAKAVADTNPAGYFRVGFESGDWPPEQQRPGFSKRRWIEETSWRLDPEDAHSIIDDWRDVDPVERAALHQYADEARDRHADEQTSAPELADAAEAAA